jgi:hypothetical protein
LNRLAASFILGYHGCDKAVGDAIVSGAKAFQPSDNDYDWLGGGAYFWAKKPAARFRFCQNRGEKEKAARGFRRLL